MHFHNHIFCFIPNPVNQYPTTLKLISLKLLHPYTSPLPLHNGPMHAITQSTGTTDNILCTHKPFQCSRTPFFQHLCFHTIIPGALPPFVSFNALFTSSLVISLSHSLLPLLAPEYTPTATISAFLSSCTFSYSSKYSAHLFLASFPFKNRPFTSFTVSSVLDPLFLTSFQNFFVFSS